MESATTWAASGSLGEVVTPPYDVIGPELQEHFYNLHPNSFIRIDLNRFEPAGDDDEANNRYTRAAKILQAVAVIRAS